MSPNLQLYKIFFLYELAPFDTYTSSETASMADDGSL